MRTSVCYCRLVKWIKQKLALNHRQGSQTTLYCALADNVQGLTYYQNCLGVVPSSDISYDKSRAAALWDLSNKLTSHFQSANSSVELPQ